MGNIEVIAAPRRWVEAVATADAPPSLRLVRPDETRQSPTKPDNMPPALREPQGQQGQHATPDIAGALVHLAESVRELRSFLLTRGSFGPDSANMGESVRALVGQQPDAVPTPIARDVAAWVNDKRRRGQRDWRRDEAALKAIIEACGWSDASGATPASFAAHLAERREAGLTGRTLNRLQSLVSTFLAFVHRIRPADVPINWARGLAKSDTDDATDGRRVFRLSEFQTLVTWADKHAPDQARFYRFLGYTGVRYGDTRLTWDQVFLDECPRIELSRKTKSKKPRTVPIHADLLPVLKTLHSARDGQNFAVFVARPTLRTLQRHCVKAGLDAEGIGFHSFRKFFATQCAAQGVPLSVAQKILGHSTPVLTTRFYQHLETNELADSLANLRVLAEKSLDRVAVVADTRSTSTMRIHTHNSDATTTAALSGGIVEEHGAQAGLPSFSRRLPDSPSQAPATPQASKPRAGIEPATCGLQNRTPTELGGELADRLADVMEACARVVRLLGADRDQTQQQHRSSQAHH